MGKKVRCPDCRRSSECVKVGEGFTIYFANTKFVWYHCKRCDKKFVRKEKIHG